MRIFRMSWGIVFRIWLRVIAYLWSRDRRLVAIGAWGGRTYSDNSKYFAEYLLTRSDFKVVWIGGRDVGAKLPAHPRMSFAVKGSWDAMLALLRAGTWVCCQSISWDLTEFPVWGRANLINLWHGSGPKKMGRNTPWRQHHPVERRSTIFNLYSAFNQPPIPWTLTPSDCLAEVLAEGEPEWFQKCRMLKFGTPRNDYLIQNKGNANLQRELREKYANMFGFNPRKKIVLYLPTWRMSNAPVFSFYGLASGRRAKFEQILNSACAVLLEKHHVKTLEQKPVEGVLESLFVVPERLLAEIDTQELLLITDVLITEYSSAYIDFALLGRPCLHFAYDLEYYETEDQGIAYDYEKIVGGAIVRTADELLLGLDEALKNGVQQLGDDFHKLVKYETGTACEQLLDFIRAEGC